MRTRFIFPCFTGLIALAACSISDEIVVREDVIEQQIESHLSPGTMVVQRITRFDDAMSLPNLAPAVMTVDGVGMVVMAGYCPVQPTSQANACETAGQAVPLVGFCGVFRDDGSLQQFPCPSGRFGDAVRAGASVFLALDETSYLIDPGQAPRPVKVKSTEFPLVSVEYVVGASAAPSSVLRARDTHTDSTTIAPEGFDIHRIRLDTAGVASDEVAVQMPCSTTSRCAPLWVEEIEQGRIAYLYTRETGAQSETVYHDASEVIVPLPPGISPDQIHRSRDGTLWLSNRDEQYLYRWNPDQGGPVEQVSIPSSTLGEWLPMLGFFNARAQTTTADPEYSQFKIPTAYEALHFTGSGLVRSPVALTPCTTREACREIGESYLLAVMGAGPDLRALYAFWPWETPQPYDPEAKEPNHQAMGMYLAPLRGPDDPVGDAGAPDTSAEAAPDGEAPEADVTIEAAPEAAMEAATCVDAANTFCDDRDGRAYRQVTIEGQTWMAENLAFDAPGSRCYNDDPANCVKYGRLYQWAIAMAGAVSSDKIPSGVQGVCPNGWHLPSKPEWGLLNSNVGPGSAGAQLKSTELGGTDDWGFSVLGGGYAIDTGSGPMFVYEGTDANFWSTTEVDAQRAWHFFFTQGSITMGEADSDTKLFHYSIRCIKD